MSFLQKKYANAGGGNAICMYENTTYSVFGTDGQYIVYHVINNVALTDISYSVYFPGGGWGSGVRGMCTDGSYLYFANNSAITKIQIGQSTYAAIVADPSGSYSSQMVTDGTYVWQMNISLNAVDVRNSSSLALYGRVNLPSLGAGIGNAYGGLCINNNTVWLNDINGVASQVCYINTSAPTTLVTTAIPADTSAYSIAVDNNYIWVSSISSRTITKYNVTSPYALVNTINLSTAPYYIVSNGTQVWSTSTSNSQLYYFDCNATGTITPSNINFTPNTCVHLASALNQSGFFTGRVVTSNTNDNSVTEFYQLPPPYPCFKEGTKILTVDGYVPIEELRQGDLVKTLKHNYVPINMIGKSVMYNSGGPERIKQRLYRCSKREYKEVFEDLIITGCHSILVNDFASNLERDKAIEVNGRVFATDNKYRLPAVSDERAEPYEIKGEFTIYHLALNHDNYYMNYGIYANGLLVESCSKRMMKEISGMKLIE